MPTAPRDGKRGWPPVLQPDVQIDFYLRLEEIRKRGSRNTDIGQTATRRVFDLIAEIASKYVKVRTETNLIVVNPAGRTITVKFAHDPDVAVEDVTGGEVRPIVSIEIKGGGDVSNIHNRIGEAEKSHQKARARGFYRFWTILGARVDPTMAARESPTTNDFYQLGEIQAPATPAAKEFKGDISAVLNIPAPRTGRRRS